MPKGPDDQKRPADVIGKAVHVMRIPSTHRFGRHADAALSVPVFRASRDVNGSDIRIRPRREEIKQVPPNTPPTDELRQSPRRRVLLSAKIVSRDGVFSADCAIRNISERGAQVDVQAEMLFPVRFYLVAGRLPVAYDAEVVWKRGEHVGLVFHQSFELSDENSAPRFVQRFFQELRPRESQ
jgi:hypothetical protein